VAATAARTTVIEFREPYFPESTYESSPQRADGPAPLATAAKVACYRRLGRPRTRRRDHTSGRRLNEPISLVGQIRLPDMRSTRCTRSVSVLTSKASGCCVHAHAGHPPSPAIDRGSVRMQLTRRDLPVVLKTLIDAVRSTAAVSE